MEPIPVPKRQTEEIPMKTIATRTKHILKLTKLTIVGLLSIALAGCPGSGILFLTGLDALQESHKTDLRKLYPDIQSPEERENFHQFITCARKTRNERDCALRIETDKPYYKDFYECVAKGTEQQICATDINKKEQYDKHTKNESKEKRS